MYVYLAHSCVGHFHLSSAGTDADQLNPTIMTVKALVTFFIIIAVVVATPIIVYQSISNMTNIVTEEALPPRTNIQDTNSTHVS